MVQSRNIDLYALVVLIRYCLFCETESVTSGSHDLGIQQSLLLFFWTILHRHQRHVDTNMSTIPWPSWDLKDDEEKLRILSMTSGTHTLSTRHMLTEKSIFILRRTHQAHYAVIIFLNTLHVFSHTISSIANCQKLHFIVSVYCKYCILWHVTYVFYVMVVLSKTQKYNW